MNTILSGLWRALTQEYDVNAAKYIYSHNKILDSVGRITGGMATVIVCAAAVWMAAQGKEIPANVLALLQTVLGASAGGAGMGALYSGVKAFMDRPSAPVIPGK